MTPHTPFKPAWWLRNSHFQTIWPVLFRKRHKKALRLIAERLELPDGDFLDLVWTGQENKPIVLLLHGLEGSIHSHYAQGLLQSVTQQGWRGVLMHFRGCSGEPNRLARKYHSGETQDLAFVVNTIQSRFPKTPMAAIGISLGGNVLLKWLGETGVNNPLVAAIAISVPYELHKTAQRIQRGFSRFYQWHLLKCLLNRTIQKFQTQACPIDLNKIKTIQTISDFDDYVTAPLHGFSGKDEYYASASCKQYLIKIRVPTLLIHAKDDPFMTTDIIPSSDDLSDCITLEVTEKGGHVGFVSGSYPWKPQYWLDSRAPEFLKRFLGNVLGPLVNE